MDRNGKDSFLSSDAAALIAEIRDPDPVDYLLCVLKNEPVKLSERIKSLWSFRSALGSEVAAEALGNIGDARAIEPLLAYLTRHSNQSWSSESGCGVIQVGEKTFSEFFYSDKAYRSAVKLISKEVAKTGIGYLKDLRIKYEVVTKFFFDTRLTHPWGLEDILLRLPREAILTASKDDDDFVRTKASDILRRMSKRDS